MVRYVQAALRPLTSMQRPELDNDFEIAYEVMIEDLGFELKKRLKCEPIDGINGALVGVRNGLRGHETERLISRDNYRNHCSSKNFIFLYLI